MTFKRWMSTEGRCLDKGEYEKQEQRKAEKFEKYFSGDRSSDDTEGRVACLRCQP